jgi:hypothetical protein
MSRHLIAEVKPTASLRLQNVGSETGPDDSSLRIMLWKPGLHFISVKSRIYPIFRQPTFIRQRLSFKSGL